MKSEKTTKAPQHCQQGNAGAVQSAVGRVHTNYDLSFGAKTSWRQKAQYQTYEEKLTPDERNIFIDVFTYAAKILTNIKKKDQAEETFEALNRIIKDNDGLKTWALGMSVKYKAMLEKAQERKSAQYYRTVVYNDNNRKLCDHHK